MKASTRFAFLLILISLSINILAQNGFEGKKSVYLQLGASGGFSPDFSQPVLMPKLGFEATLGLIGFRADGQFFKTSPAFDINGYLDPIKSVLTISNLQENNSNVLLGFSPYLSFGKKALNIQPGIGLKYLMQKGATATAVYNQTPATSILKFPDGEANRNLLLLEPNIRASLGKPGKFLRFFVEAGYTIPLGNNEFSYTSRNLTNVVDSRGNVDIKTLLNSKEIITTGKALPAFANVGAGLEIKLFTTTQRGAGNNYGINDDGIKRTGEPVPGAEIYVELENDDKPLMKGKTDHIGTYHFKNLEYGKYKLTCVVPPEEIAKNAELTKGKKLYVNFIVEGDKSPITFGSKTGKLPLLFESPEFNIKNTGKNLKVHVVTHINNYGINDDGIKATGEPVPGAEVYIELETDDDPIANITTDENGDFVFTMENPPVTGNFVFTILPPKSFALKHKLSLATKPKVKARLVLNSDGKFRGKVKWFEIKLKAENRGAFAVSGKNST